MSTNKIFATLWLLWALGFCSIQAQEYEINATNLLLTPKEVLDKSNAVIKYELTNIKLLAKNKLNMRYRKVLTIFNQRGDRGSRAGVAYDPETKIKYLRATIYDAFGNEVKKIRKKDFTDVSAVDGFSLYRDDRVKYLRYVSTAYPYTIDFEYEIETTTTAFIPSWNPVGGSYTGVQESVYQISWNEGLSVDKKEYNLEGYAIETKHTANSYWFKVNNLPPFKVEDYEPLDAHFKPSVRFRSKTFHLNGVDGTIDNWQNFGKWMNTHLLHDVNDLSLATKEKMRSLTKGVQDPLKKAEIVVSYLQENTRYVSVQIGVGGWKPMKASEVDALGYGDCKALSNYTKSLLEAVGVTSYYTVIYGEHYGPKGLDAEFASMQGNHVILAIEDAQGNLVWNDCTSQIHPFGFVGDFTDNRNALVIKPTGGEIVRTVAYLNQENAQKSEANLALKADGSLQGNLKIVSTGTKFDTAFKRVNYSKKQQEKAYKQRKWGYLNNLDIEEVAYEADKDKVVFTESFKLKISDYPTKVHSNLLFSPNIFNRANLVPDRYRKRKHDLSIYRGWQDEDFYNIKLPEEYRVGQLPEAVAIKNEFGSYQMRISLKEGVLIYHRKVAINAGQHPASAYASFRAFMRKVHRYDKTKIELVKKES